MFNKAKLTKQKSQSFLNEIVEKKKEELSVISNNITLLEKQIGKSYSSQNFLKVFTNKKKKKIRLISEVKFASPINPHLGSQKELVERVKLYEKAGSDAISVITEKHFFKGDILLVSKVKSYTTLPILQKDFIIDASQIYEAKRVGSDALLLIARLVTKETLSYFVKLCFAEGIEPVVEINDEKDLNKALATETNIIAVNARDLETFRIDFKLACNLLQKIPLKFTKLAFSGIHSSKEVLLYKEAGAMGILVGTGLMLAKDIDNFIQSLIL